jgi:hypothetical protein
MQRAPIMIRHPEALGAQRRASKGDGHRKSAVADLRT